MSEVRLSNVIEIISGGTPNTSVEEYWNGNIEWLSVADFNNDERYVYSAEKKITDKGLAESNTKLLQKGDLIISARGTVGALAQLVKPMAFNQSCFGLRGKEGVVFTDFLYYWLKNYVKIFLNKSQGSVFNTINLATFDDIKIHLPAYNIQVEIVKLLTKIDQKIALNNQINNELEAMAKTLYDYWFVQFDFPDENGKPYKSSGGKMVYNDQLKREIPEGWGVKRLGEICNPTSGYPFASNTYVQDGKFKIYTIKNVQDNGILPITDNTLDTLPANLPEKCILGPGDMLMSLTGNVGRVGIVFEDNALLNQRVLKIESKYKAFIFQFLKDPRTRSLLENTATGTSQKNLSPKDVMDISIIFPGFNVLIEFEQISNEILLQITSNNQQNQELTQLRDWLLPMLMNGQVRVEQGE